MIGNHLRHIQFFESLLTTFKLLFIPVTGVRSKYLSLTISSVLHFSSTTILHQQLPSVHLFLITYRSSHISLRFLLFNRFFCLPFLYLPLCILCLLEAVPMDPLPNALPVHSSSVTIIVSCSIVHQSQGLERAACSRRLGDGEGQADVSHVEGRRD